MTTRHPAARNTASTRPSSAKIGAMAVFVSYSSRDEVSVQKLISAFRLADEQVWWDEELGGGESWWRMILEKIRGCDVFVFALSQNSLRSKSCQAELRYAQDLGKPIVPVQIGTVESMRVNPFAATHVVDYRHPDVDTGIRLISDVRRTRRQPLPDPLPSEPPMPYAYLIRLNSDVSGPRLIPQKQAQLLEELKERFNEDGADATARADLARLLYQLRDRADTTEDTRVEIDVMLESLDLKRPGARRISWMLAGASVLVVVVVTVVVALTVFGGDGSKLIKPAQLEKVLLTTNQVDAIMGTSDMKGDPPDKVTHDTPGGVNPPDCFGAFYNAAPDVYKNTGYTDARNQALTSPATGAWINQSGIEFHSPSQASSFVRYLAGSWKICANQPVEMTEKDGKSIWAFAPLDDNGSQIVQTLTLRSKEKNYGCQHTLRPESNVVIEVQVCSDRVSEASIHIADGIADKVIDLTN